MFGEELVVQVGDVDLVSDVVAVGDDEDPLKRVYGADVVETRSSQMVPALLTFLTRDVTRPQPVRQ